MGLTFIIFLLVGLIIMIELPDKVNLANAKFTDFKLATILAMLLYAILQTALAEEILFRGFIAKRLQHRCGYLKANLSQAVLFGGLHGVMLLNTGTNWLFIIFIVALTSCIAFMIDEIDEKLAGGSILPGICIHSGANIVSSLILMSGLI